MPDDSAEVRREKERWFRSLTPGERFEPLSRWMEESAQRDPELWERERNRVPTHTMNYQILEMRDGKPHITYGPGSAGAREP